VDALRPDPAEAAKVVALEVMLEAVERLEHLSGKLDGHEEARIIR
jgi:hypothetical protein